MSVTRVLYKDVAPGAATDAKATSNEGAQDSNLNLIPLGASPASVITLEPNRWLLDGTFVFRETQKLAFWSTLLSDEHGLFSNPPVITIDFTKQYSSTGITLVFDESTGEYCSSVNIKWYQGEELKSDVNFYPDSPSYFCENLVTSYSKIVVTLNKTSLPYRYAKVNHIVFGVLREFGMGELRNASVVNEMDGTTKTLPISTFKWTLDSRKDVTFLFQLKQPVEIRNDSNVLGVYYIDEHDRKSDRIYEIQCYDAIGVLDESPFSGGVYTNKSAKELLEEIIGSDFVIEYAESVIDTQLSGVIVNGSKRQACQQVLFAWGVCVATSGGESIRVFNLDDTLSNVSEFQTFPGVSIQTDSIVTEVQVTAHEYTQNASGDVEINGVRYSDKKTLYTVSNPDVTANDKQNVKEFPDATLVYPSNAQSVAQRLYDWYMRRDTAKASIVWKGEALGDYVSFPNSWDGPNAGTITKMEIKLSNTVVAKCESVGQGG